MDINISLTAEVTEFAVMPKKINTKNVFNIQNKSMVISFCDDKENVLHQSEISISDAKILAEFITKLR